MEKKEMSQKRGKGGRPAKNDTASNCVMVRFTDQEHARFISLYEQSGLLAKAVFIKARVFDESFKVIKTDEGTLKFVAKLTQMHAQFRAVGTNYNQVVKELHINFSQKRALQMLYKLEKETIELAIIGKQIIALCDEFKQIWFPK